MPGTPTEQVRAGLRLDAALFRGRADEDRKEIEQEWVHLARNRETKSGNEHVHEKRIETLRERIMYWEYYAKWLEDRAGECAFLPYRRSQDGVSSPCSR